MATEKSRPLTEPPESETMVDQDIAKARVIDESDSLRNNKANGSITGYHRKLKPKRLQIIANMQIVNDLDKMELLEQSVDSNTSIFGDKSNQ